MSATNDPKPHKFVQRKARSPRWCSGRTVRAPATGRAHDEHCTGLIHTGEAYVKTADGKFVGIACAVKFYGYKPKADP